MMCIVEEQVTGRVEHVALTVASMMTGVNMMEMIPGVAGRGFKVLGMYHPTNPHLREAQFKAR